MNSLLVWEKNNTLTTTLVMLYTVTHILPNTLKQVDLHLQIKQVQFQLQSTHFAGIFNITTNIYTSLA